MTLDIIRCEWCGTDPLYIEYHDKEWGRQITDDRRLFEFIILEGAQAGLSWITILRRRGNYRKAFADFDPAKVAIFSAGDIERLMNDEGIIRNRRKIESAITNARLFLDIQKEYGNFYNYILEFFPGNKRVVNNPENHGELVCTSPFSDAMSKDMKSRGFTFFGSTICYSFLQATGFIDDHIVSCHCKTDNL